MKNFFKKNKSTNKKVDNAKYINVTFILIKVASCEIIVIPPITINTIKFIKLSLEIFLSLIYSITVKIKVVIDMPIVATNMLKNLYSKKNTAGGKNSIIFDNLVFKKLI